MLCIIHYSPQCYDGVDQIEHHMGINVLYSEFSTPRGYFVFRVKHQKLL